MDFIKLVKLAFEPYLKLVIIIRPSKHIRAAQIPSSSMTQLPSISLFILLIPFFFIFKVFQISISPVKSTHLYFVLFQLCWHSMELRRKPLSQSYSCHIPRYQWRG